MQTTIWNHIKERSKLHNTFYVIRHGESLANVSQLIKSDYKYQRHIGLTDRGKEQILNNLDPIKKFDKKPIILSP